MLGQLFALYLDFASNGFTKRCASLEPVKYVPVLRSESAG